MSLASASIGKRNLLTNALANWGGFAAQVLVTLWLTPILLRGLGVGRYGIWALVESVLAYLMLFDLGVAASLVRYVAKYEAIKDRKNLNRVFSTSLCIFLSAGAGALLLAGAGALFLGNFAHIPAGLVEEGRWMLLLLGANLAIGLPLNVFPSILDGLGRFPAKTLIRTISLAIRVPLFLWVIQVEGGLIELAWVITSLNLLEHGLMALVAKRYLPNLRFSFSLVDWATFRTIRGYSVAAFIAMVAGRISFQTDAIVIGLFLAPESIAYFMLAAKLVEYAKSSLRSATTVLTPAISTLESQGDLGAIRQVLTNSTRLVLWIMFPIQLGLILLGEPFLTRWLQSSADAAHSYPILLILALPLSLAMMQSVSSRILYGMGRLRWFARLMILEALCNLGLSLLLVGTWGIAGVAWGTTVPNLIFNMVVAVYACRVLEVPVGHYLRQTLVMPAFAAALLGSAWLLAVNFVELTSWFSLISVGLAGVASYALIALLFECGPKRVARQINWLTGNRLHSHADQIRKSPCPNGLVPRRT